MTSPTAFFSRMTSSKMASLRQYLFVPVCVAVILCSSVYLSYAVYFDVAGSKKLIILAILVVLVMAYHVVKETRGARLRHAIRQHCSSRGKNLRKIITRLLWALAVAGLCAFIVYDAVTFSPLNLISLSGLFVMFALAFVTSRSPALVEWSVVVRGVVVLLVTALLVMRWQTGNDVIAWLADVITGFLNMAQHGAAFVFGETYYEHGFALAVMPLLCYFTAVSSTLYYVGALQQFVAFIGRILETLIGASKVESFVAAANIFFGPDTSVIMIQSMVPTLTTSQLFTLYSCGLATIDAGMIPIYQNIGVPASQLVSASMMSAPAALIFSKLMLPESRDHSKSDKQKALVFKPSEHSSLLDAFCGGAINAIPIISQVLAVLLSCISLLQFVNSTLTWFGSRVGVQQLTVQEICSYVFMPLTLLMGVAWEDCRHVARLIGLKTIVNEYVAYSELATLIDNRHNNRTDLPTIQPRSEAIAAYALCGFSNIGSAAVLAAVLISMAPSRRGDIMDMAARALVAGSLACFCTACMAGTTLFLSYAPTGRDEISLQGGQP